MSVSSVLRVLGSGALLIAPFFLIAGAATYIAYVHYGVFVSGSMPSGSELATTHLNIGRWVWRLAPIASFVVALVGARVIGAGSRLAGMLVISFLTLQWIYAVSIFFDPKDFMGALWETP